MQRNRDARALEGCRTGQIEPPGSRVARPASLRVLLIVLAWLTLPPAAADADHCGGPGQRACCIGETAFGACQDGLTEVPGCSNVVGNCACRDSNGNETLFDATSHCVQATPCGGEGQRACCVFEASFGACDGNLMEIPGCAGDCLCGGDSNPFAIEASGTCVKTSPCGHAGERACCSGETGEILEGCNEGQVFEIPGCVGNCFCGRDSHPTGAQTDDDSKGGAVSAGTCAAVPLQSIAEPSTDATPAAHSCSSLGLRGYSDLHLHLFSHLAHGGGVLGGKSYDPVGGVNAALGQDFTTDLDLEKRGEDVPAPTLCPLWLSDEDCQKTFFHGDHDILKGDSLGAGTGDLAKSNLGAPIFNGWPKWTSTTHQQAYYKWLERAWQGGLRLTTMLAVTNEALCRGSKRLKGTECTDSMDSIDQQIQAAKDFEAWIDEKHGGPGKGWFRIVRTPLQARQAIAKGKLAVVLGIETAEMFNCKFPIDQCDVYDAPVYDGVTGEVIDYEDFGYLQSCSFLDDTNSREAPLPICTEQYIKDQVAKYYDMGVRHVFPVHNFDNAFGGSATWNSTIEIGNRVVEDHWWRTLDCGDKGYGFALGDFFTAAQQILIAELGFGVSTGAPLRDEDASCNEFGLLPLGRILMRELMDKGMLIDVDHLSARAFDETLDLADARSYPVVATHVLSFDMHEQEIRHERMRTRAQLERIRDGGGMIAAMLKDDVQDTGNKGKKLMKSYGAVADDCRHSSKSFAQAYQYAVDLMQAPVAMGSDFNGTAGHFGPRFGPEACGGAVDYIEDIGNPFPAEVGDRRKERSAQYRAGNMLRYPFTLDGFGQFEAQKTGQRTFDYNFDGMAHVGLLPDFVADLEAIGLPQRYLDALFGSAEEYIRVWERATATTASTEDDTPAQAIDDICNYNVLPEIVLTSPAASVALGEHFQQIVEVKDDPLERETLSLTAEWGDGSSDSYTLSQPGLVALLHLYGQPVHPDQPYQVVLTVSDGAPGGVTSRTIEVVVRDTIPPVLSVPASITADATSVNGAVVRFTASATDNLDGAVAVTCNPDSGRQFGFGTTHVTCSAADAAGNTSTAGFDVTVADTSGPVITVPANIFIEGGSQNVTYSVSAHDAVDGDGPVSCSPASGSTFRQGFTTVACQAQDTKGNGSTNAFSVFIGDLGSPPSVIVPQFASPAHRWSFDWFAPTALDGGLAPQLVNGIYHLGGFFYRSTCAGTGQYRSAGASNDSYVDFGGVVAQLGTSDFSLALWFNSLAIGQSGKSTLLSTRSGPAVGFLELRREGGALAVELRDDAGNGVIASGGSGLNADAWHHVVVRRSGQQLALFVDGQQIAGGSLPVNLSVSSQPLLLGKPATPDASAFLFHVDDFQLFERALTDQEIVSLVNAVNDADGDGHCDVADIEADAGPNGVADVAYAVRAIDPIEGELPVTCSDGDAAIAATGSTFPIGTTTVMCTSTDSINHSSSASFTIRVRPAGTPPVASIIANRATGGPPPATLFESMQLLFIASGEPTDGDTVSFVAATCGSAPAVNPTITSFAYGAASVVFRCTMPDGPSTLQASATFRDRHGDSTATVSLPVVNLAPVISRFDVPPGSVPQGQAAEVFVQASDAGGAGDPLTATIQWGDGTSSSAALPGSLTLSHAWASAGTFTLTLVVSDDDGGSRIATRTVKVGDTTPPTITVPQDLTAEARSPAGAPVTFAPSATDNVDGPVAVSCAPASGATFPLGTTTVACSASDAAGNSASASFHVTVVDTTPPGVAVPQDVTLEADGPFGAFFGANPGAHDAVSGFLPTTCTPPAAGPVFPLGTTRVTCSATDAAGNVGSASFTVTVVDTTPPALTLPGPITAEATSPAGAAVSFSASATDRVDGAVAVSCSPASGSTFALGGSSVTCSARDAAGNSASASFSITVADTTLPAVDLPQDVTLEAEGPFGASFGAIPSAHDAVSGSLPTTCTPPAAGPVFPLGTTRVTCFATDAAGNVGSASFTVTVVDTTPPALTLPGPITAEATSPAGAAVSFSASATDRVDGAVAVSCSPASGSTFALGGSTVTCSATDQRGNSSTGSFNLNVVDTTPPEISLSVSPDANAAGWHKDPVTIDWAISDVVGVSESTGCDDVTLIDESAGTVVTCTARDAAGNATSRSVTVKLDRTAPSIAFGAASPDANANGWHRYDVSVPFTISDAVSGLPAGAASSGTLTFTVEGAGLTRAVTATDVAGNAASVVSPAVNLDKTPPSIGGSRSPNANANGWNNGPVTVSFSCQDALSGVDACSPGTTVGAEGAGQSRTGTARDRAGNEASDVVGGINIDLTPPRISATRDRPPNANNWYNADVSVSFACQDALSGVAFCNPPQTIGNEGANQSATGLARDLADNEASVTEAGINLDETPPTIVGSRTPEANAAGWNSTDVTVSFACADALSAIETCTPPATVSSEGANQSHSGAATDRAGNSASATVSGISIDKTSPVVACSNSAPSLWPPNHKLVSIRTAVTVDGGLSGSSGFTLLRITSNEPDNGLGDGDTAGDIQGFVAGTPDTDGQLRAERSGGGNGRVYAFVYEGSDVAGNRASCTTTVAVPHSQATVSESGAGGSGKKGK
jgi:microsomal dipeptidase-like Zn-dependent dipeptidase